MLQEWKELNRQEEGDYYIFRVETIERQSPRTGKSKRFVALNSPDWINILPITSDGQVIFVNQFRHGSAEFTMEVPAGMVDPHETDDPLMAAKRELMEETGFSAETVVHLGSVQPNPAFLNNWCHIYLALNCVKVQDVTFDNFEDIEIELVPLDQIEDLVTSGRITHSLVLNNFYLFNRWRANPENQAKLPEQGT
ncbi:MAG: NUDIX hydrolase [Candidatus Promineifilaceae bacterium]